MMDYLKVIETNQYLSPLNTPERRRVKSNDRFIPNRSELNTESSFYLLNVKDNDFSSKSPEVLMQETFIEEYLMKGSSQKNIINVSHGQKENVYNGGLNDLKKCSASLKAIKAEIIVDYVPKVSLDADVVNDFYMNLIDWSLDEKLIVALQKDLFLYDKDTKKTLKLDLKDDQADKSTNASNLSHNGSYISVTNESPIISSVKWHPWKENILAVASQDATLKIWDVEKNKLLCKIIDHKDRVCSIDWKEGHVVSSGNKHGTILIHDLRTKNMQINTIDFHKYEVCGLKWNSSKQLLASGSEDTNILIWDSRTAKPYVVFSEHKAAIKAIDWCPWKSNLIVSGAGKADGSIKIWSIFQEKSKKTLQIDSQVSGISWCENKQSIVASYEENISAWKYPSLRKSGMLTGHTDRTLCLVKSKTELYASLGADNSLHVWDCFERMPVRNDERFSHNTSPIGTRTLSNFISIR